MNDLRNMAAGEAKAVEATLKRARFGLLLQKRSVHETLERSAGLKKREFPLRVGKASRPGLRWKRLLPILISLVIAGRVGLRAETISVVVASNAAPRVEFGAERLAEALKSAGADATVVRADRNAGRKVRVMREEKFGGGNEGFKLEARGGGDVTVTSGDDSGLLYGCLELAKRVKVSGKLPAELDFADAPMFVLRGPCIGMQKPYLLPGHKVYEYPYTPELFPFFYDKAFWREYLDFLVENRMNTLYLWNGHPFASLVKLKDYPYALEVPDDVFKQNTEMFRYITEECDKRGIWLVQMFYNIIVSKPFAEHNGTGTQFSAPTPVVSDYTRKSIAEFVREYPNVGLMVCLGEALQGTTNQLEWFTNTIAPGVKDGMAQAGIKDQPPLVLRTHAMDSRVILPVAYRAYTNLYTESKYNGESLTTWEPRGSQAALQVEAAKLGPAHLINVHILSNLEPFRYGAQDFIRKSAIAGRDRLSAKGVHVYPLCYWNWPDSADIADPPLKQWKRDWIWFEAWARYSWNADRPEAEDRVYWVGRIADMYGSTNAASHILDAYNESGECAPRILRRFGITEGNRQTMSLGMTLDQLVNPKKYKALVELWESQSPPGERLQEFVDNEWEQKPHTGETPETTIRDVMGFSKRAVESVEAAAPEVKKNKDEFGRLRNDIYCIRTMSEYYAAKVEAAEHVLRYEHSHDSADMEAARAKMAESLERYEHLVDLTKDTYRFANGMQTSQRKIPVSGGANGSGANYHWTQLLPMYRAEMKTFEAKVAALEQGGSAKVPQGANVKPLPAAEFTVLSRNAEKYRVDVGARPFTDRDFTIASLAGELTGLSGIRFSHEKAKKGGYSPVEFEVSEPVQVLVGYFKSPDKTWLQVPNLETVAQADERGGVDTVIENAAVIEGLPGVDVHAFKFSAGKQKLEMIGQGSFVVLGVVPASVNLQKRDAGLMPAGAKAK